MQSFLRFLVRANMRRIKRVGKEFGKAMKGEEKHGDSTVSNRVRDSRVLAGGQKVGQAKPRTETMDTKEQPREPEEETREEVPRERYDPYFIEGQKVEEDPPVNKHIENEIMRGPNIAAVLDERDLREDAFAAVGELSAVVKKIVYWTNQTQVQEVLWHAIEHEQDRYVRHILETVLAQVERTPEPEV